MPQMQVRIIHGALILAALLLARCQSPEALGRLDGAISPDELRAHLRILSDDIMEGRAPGTRGAEMAAKYIASQFQEASLLPAVGDSTYFQQVELIGIKPTPFLQIRGFGAFWQLRPGQDFVAWTQLEQENVSIRNKEVLFVGYGIDAPEFNWNDYRGIDVTGKVLLMLVNEPPSQSESFFAGEALTYYARWTYKFEEAARKGAEGVILIHTAPMAGYDWNVVQNSRTRERFQIRPPGQANVLSLQAWITEQMAQEILRAGSFELHALIAQAASSSFSPLPLDLRVSAVIRNRIRGISAANVIARLEGSDPLLRQQAIIYTSHYDHLGKNDVAEGDGIFNGAIDNASGTSALLAIARAFAHSPIKPKRTVLFAAVTAEESGLLGSQFYAEHPTFPLENIAANLNIDALNVHGRTRDIIALGAERSTLEGVVRRVAHEMNLELSPDPEPGQGLFFRSDQFSFAKKGVPAMVLNGGLNYWSKPADWGARTSRDYWQNRYHTVDDEFDPNWSLEGTAQIAQFALKAGLYLANAPEMPVWHENEPFRRMRD